MTTKRVFLIAAAPLLIASAFAAEQDWAKLELPQPPAIPASRPISPEADPGHPVESLHTPPAHMNITHQAFEIYTARFGGSELARHIGKVVGGKAVPDDSVVAGAFDEDSAFKNPWNQPFPMANHFWDCRQGFYKGWNGNDSGVNRAHKFWSGGYGIENSFDGGWTGKGVKGEGVIALYRKGDKAKAYWYLGHVAHLLEDLTVPAHTHLFTHVAKGSDAYETYMKQHFQEWTADPRTPIETFDTLFDLFYRTCDVTNDFDAGNGSGSNGRDGETDKGARRADGFTEAELKEEGAVLMPLAYRRVAALYVFFYKQIDKTPPHVELADLSSKTTEVELKVKAEDEASGVDKFGYVFEFRDLGAVGGWQNIVSPVGTSAPFTGQPGHLYEFRASAVDAAGNRGFSAPRQWRAGNGVTAR